MHPSVTNSRNHPPHATGSRAARGLFCPAANRRPEAPLRRVRRVDLLINCAEAHSIAYQLAAEGRATGTDANAIQINRAGVATALSVPNRYMHSPVEMISLDDIDRAADLLARFAERVTEELDFVP